MTIYKYLPSKYVDEVMGKGNILFRSLNYFIEEYNEQSAKPVRRDEDEGRTPYTDLDDAKVYVNNLELPLVPETLKMSEELKNPETYFIFSCSNKLDKSLYKDFKSDACIEILNIEKFMSRLQKSLNFSTLKHGDITYYDKAINKTKKDLLLYKESRYYLQSEHRFYFQVNYSKNNDRYHWSSTTETGLILHGRITEAVLQIGSLADIARVHSLT